MGAAVAGTMIASFTWTQYEGTGLATQSDSGNVYYNLSFGSSGVYAMSKVWHDSDTIASNTTVLIDLYSLVREVLDGQFTTYMTSVKGFLIRNQSSTGDLHFGGAHANRFTAMYASGNAVHRIGPNGFFAFSYPVSGLIPTSGTASVIRLYNPQSVSCQYSIVLLGVGPSG